MAIRLLREKICTRSRGLRANCFLPIVATVALDRIEADDEAWAWGRRTMLSSRKLRRARL